MREDDVPAVRALATETFDDLNRRLHEPVAPRPEPDAAYMRYRTVLAL
jgi:hypothetical protein